MIREDVRDRSENVGLDGVVRFRYHAVVGFARGSGLPQAGQSDRRGVRSELLRQLEHLL